MSEVVNEQKEKKAKDPFIRLDKCQTIINELDYDSNGRLTYMPYNGVYCEPDATNKVISTPDASSVALAYTDYCVRIINATIFNFAEDIKRGFFNAALSNIDYILTDRLKFETANMIHTIFSAGTRALMKPYIINPEIEDRAYNVVYHDYELLHFSNMFYKDIYENESLSNNVPRLNDYAVDPNDVILKTGRIIPFIAADISHSFTRYIYMAMPNFDVNRFVSDQIASIGLDRSVVSTDTDYPYAASVLNESAHNDLVKIVELIEMLVNHAFYVFCRYHKDFLSYSPKMLAVKQAPNPNLNTYKKPCYIEFDKVPF